MKLDSADDRPTGIDIKSAPLEADTMGMDFSTDEKKLPYRKPEPLLVDGNPSARCPECSAKYG